MKTKQQLLDAADADEQHARMYTASVQERAYASYLRRRAEFRRWLADELYPEGEGGGK